MRLGLTQAWDGMQLGDSLIIDSRPMYAVAEVLRCSLGQ